MRIYQVIGLFPFPHCRMSDGRFVGRANPFAARGMRDDSDGGKVSKRIDAPYRSGKVKTWPKIKNPEAPIEPAEAGSQAQN